MATQAGEEARTGAADSALGRTAYRTGRLLGRTLAFVDRVPPWLVLGSLVLLTWGIASEAARIALHNGTLYYNGGEATSYYTTSWSLGHGTMPFSEIGYGYPLLTAPIAAFAGASMLAALPAIIAFNLMVLAPIALLCIYGIVRMLAGRAYSYLACLVWVLFPVAVIHYFLAAFPAYFLLVVSVPFLLPFVGRRGAASLSKPATGRFPAVAAAVLGLLSVAGMLFVTVVPTSTASTMAVLPGANLMVPMSQFPVTATAGKRGVALSWPKQNDHGATIGYTVMRSPDTGAPDCVRAPSTSAACVYAGNVVGTTNGSETSFVDHPAPGAWVYRVGLSATPYGARIPTDLVLVSSPGRVVVHQKVATH